MVLSFVIFFIAFIFVFVIASVALCLLFRGNFYQKSLEVVLGINSVALVLCVTILGFSGFYIFSTETRLVYFSPVQDKWIEINDAPRNNSKAMRIALKNATKMYVEAMEGINPDNKEILSRILAFSESGTLDVEKKEKIDQLLDRFAVEGIVRAVELQKIDIYESERYVRAEVALRDIGKSGVVWVTHALLMIKFCDKEEINEKYFEINPFALAVCDYRKVLTDK